jgi:putative heme-binding domain-containing protein
MKSVLRQVFVLLVVVMALFLWVGRAVTNLTGGEKKAAAAVEISPEGGEAIYWGKGRCYTCHSIGDRGSAVRCPNHGAWGDKFPLAMGARAVERAKEREKATGTPYTATDYLVESLADPGAYIVEGYKNEMAVVYAPPISLSLDEIKAVVSYMQAQDGEVDIAALNAPTEVSRKFYDRIAAASAAGGGDPGHGEEVFFDVVMCADCHTLGDRGTALGPDLSSIGLKGLKHISDSILRPAESFTPGYETYTAFGKDGKEMFNADGLKISGVKVKEDAESIDIAIAANTVVNVPKSDIKELAADKNKSVMPDDLIEALTVKDFQDVLAYMLLQKGEKK